MIRTIARSPLNPPMHVAMTWRLTVMAILTMAVGTPVAGSAQAGPEGPAPAAGAAPPSSPDYRTLVDQAVREFELGNFAEARGLFSQAHAVEPNARTLRGIGLCEFELRNYPSSIAHLEAALASTEKALDEPLRKKTQDLLVRARAFVAEVLIVSEPPPTRVSVDDLPVQWSAGSPLIVPVGDHVVALSAEGLRTEKRKLTIQGGERMTLEFELSPMQAADPAALSLAAPASTPTQDDGSILESPWLWVGVGAVAVAAVVIAVVAASGGDDDPAANYGGTTGVVISGPAAGLSGAALNF